jgi:hypothetical protein
MKYNYTIYEELYKSQWIIYATLQIQKFALLSLPKFTAQSTFWERGNYSGCKKKFSIYKIQRSNESYPELL